MLTFISQFAAEEAETKAGVGALGIDGKAFLIQFITFILVYLILRRYVFKPVVKILKDRQDTIDKGIKLTSELSNQKEELDREAAEVRKAARKQADQIVADAHAQSTSMLKEAEESAQAKADAILAEAEKRIQEETARARRNLEKEMVDLVIEATEKVTREKLDAKKDNALIAAALKGRA